MIKSHRTPDAFIPFPSHSAGPWLHWLSSAALSIHSDPVKGPLLDSSPTLVKKLSSYTGALKAVLSSDCPFVSHLPYKHRTHQIPTFVQKLLRDVTGSQCAAILLSTIISLCHVTCFITQHLRSDHISSPFHYVSHPTKSKLYWI